VTELRVQARFQLRLFRLVLVKDRRKLADHAPHIAARPLQIVHLRSEAGVVRLKGGQVGLLLLHLLLQTDID